MRIAVAAAAVCLSIVGLSVAEDAGAAMKKQFTNIPAQGLGPALQTLAQQREFQVVYLSDSVDSLRTVGAVGEMTSDEALTQLLIGTGLTFRYLEDNTVTIFPSTSSASADGNQALGTGDGGTAQQGVRETSDGETDTKNQQNDSDTNQSDLSEVVVTGTHIAGSVSAGSRVITLNRDYIANSGHATVEGLLKTLPQNFSGGVGQAQAPQLSDQDARNFNEGTAVNLRGLGSDSTLVLVDGRRQPGSGIRGSFIDVSSIPTSAIERVEILPDGASALYGSDAVAGVVNFILRKDLDGAESQVRFGSAQGGADQAQFSQLFGHSWSTGNAMVGYQYDDRDNLKRRERAFSASDDLSPFGGSDFRVSYSNPGNILDPATFEPAFAIPGGQDGTSLQASDLLPGVVNLDTSSSGADLFGQNEMHSAFVNATQRVGDQVELFADGRFATRTHRTVSTGLTADLIVPSSNAFFVDPFGGSEFVVVRYNFSDDLGLGVSTGDVDTYVGTVGANVKLPAEWQVSFSGTYGRENTKTKGLNQVDFGALDIALADPDPTTAFNPFGDGSNTAPSALATIRATNDIRANSRARNLNAIATGSLFQLSESNSMLALGADFRDDEIESVQTFTSFQSTSKLDRQVKAAFAELALPFVTSGKAAALRGLSVSLAGRYEDYSDFGSTFDQRVGITWLPVDSLTVRASWGTSFKAPRLNQLVGEFPQAADFFSLLPSPDGVVNALVRFGANPDLTEETADVWSAGFEFNPTAMPSLRTSLNFWRVEYKDRIAPAGPTNNPFGILFEADDWAEAIAVDPTREQIDAVCRSPSFNFPGNPVSVDQCLATTPDAIVDLRLSNLALVTVDGVDFEGRYQVDTRAGTVAVGLNGVYTSSFDRQASKRSPTTDVINTTGNVLKLRLRSDVSWSRGDWSMGAFVNYANDYDDTFTVSGRPVKEWITVDGSVTYTFNNSATALNGLSVSLRALNILDEDPPFANVGSFNFAYGYDTANADPFGRVLSLQVRKVWGQTD